MAISPNGALIAVALGDSGTQVFPFTKGNASPIGSAYTFGSAHTLTISPYHSGGAALSVAIDPQNGLLYIGEASAFPSSSTDSGGLRVFNISPGTLSEFSYTTPYASGGLAPLSILPTASGTYVYVANGMGGTAAGNVTGFAVSKTALTLGSSVAAGVQPVDLAEDSTGSYIFEVGSLGSPYFDAYAFSSTTGSLTSQLTSTTAAGSVAIVAVP
jgi:hypothetical protein